jgi:hypothetical protein
MVLAPLRLTLMSKVPMESRSAACRLPIGCPSRTQMATASPMRPAACWKASCQDAGQYHDLAVSSFDGQT